MHLLINVPMKNKVKISWNYNNLLDRIANILVEARTKVVREINNAQVLAYWEIGREIVDFEQKGKRLDSAYVDALVRIPLFAQEATRYSKGVWSSRLRLYPEGLFEIWMPVPPLEEQRSIAAHISAETAKLAALGQVAERTTGLLKERRAALIAAAVTGKIKSLS